MSSEADACGLLGADIALNAPPSSECPPEAILPDGAPEADAWLELNGKYSEIWPNITRKGEAPADSDEYLKVEGKYEKYFSANPGSSAKG